MKDIETLLKVTERPQDYSDEEIRLLMEDAEMKAYYELMVSAETGFALREGRRRQCDELLEDKNSDSSPGDKNPSPASILLKMAALFIGVLLLSGIAYAGYRMAVDEAGEAPSESPSAKWVTEKPASPQEAIRTFENEELQEILQVLSDHYRVELVFHSEQSRHIRLYTKWDTTAPLQQMIERLNGFEKVNLRLVDNHIIVE